MPAKKTLLLLMAACAPALAAFSYKDCPDFKPEEFRYVKVVTKQSDTTLNEPVRLAFDYRGSGVSDLYIAERHGKLKRYDAVGKRMLVLGELDVFSDAPWRLPYAAEAETGINGIALDPDFKTNRRLWVFYSPFKDSTYRLSRFTLKDGADGYPEKMDSASEKIVLDIREGRKHAGSTITLPGGPLAFDSHGDLWIAIGANSEQFPSVDETYPKRSAEASSSNLADLRGSILRIHPDDSPKGYSVPQGNLGEYWGAKFTEQGRTDLAAQYLDSTKVRREIYIKGTRNPYSMNVDPVKGWVVWGDFGPDREVVEELNLANHPLYAGYPYWAGKNIFILAGREPYASANMDVRAPINNSKWNLGPKELPPAEPAMIAYSNSGNGFQVGNHPTSGPIYRYDANSDSPVKLPPHLDGAWFSVDRWSGARVFKVNETGDGYVDSIPLATDMRFTRPVDMKQGPDGAVYVVDYAGYHSTVAATHIGRIEYTGTCRPGIAVSARRAGVNAARAVLSHGSLRVTAPGRHSLALRATDGRIVSAFAWTGTADVPIYLPTARGVYILTLEPDGGRWMIPNP